MVTNMLDGLAGVGLSALSSAYATKKSYKYSLKLQKQNQAFQERMSRNAIAYRKEDAINSGVNPIFAIAGGSGASTPAGGGGTITAPDPDFNSAYVARKQLKNETELKDSQKELNNSAKTLNEENERLTNWQANNSRLDYDLKNYNGYEIADAQLANIKANTAKTFQEMKNSAALTLSQIGVNSAQAKNIYESTRNTKRDNDWFEEHPGWYAFSRGTSAVGNIFSGSVGGSIGRQFK